MSTQSKSAQWVLYVAQQRGLPRPEKSVINQDLATMGDQAWGRVSSCLLRLQNGVEQPGEMDFIDSWLSQLKRREVKPPQLVAEPKTTVRHQTSTQEAPLLRQSHHVFGSKSALCVEPFTQVGERDGAYIDPDHHTVILEFASGREKRYDWNRKLSMILTRRELPLFCAHLLGHTESFACGNHGPDRDKYLSLQDQGSHIYATIRQKNLSINIQIGPEDITPLAAMSLTALRRNYPACSEGWIESILQRTARMLNHK